MGENGSPPEGLSPEGGDRIQSNQASKTRIHAFDWESASVSQRRATKDDSRHQPQASNLCTCTHTHEKWKNKQDSRSTCYHLLLNHGFNWFPEELSRLEELLVDFWSLPINSNSSHQGFISQWVQIFSNPLYPVYIHCFLMCITYPADLYVYLPLLECQ